MADDGLSWRDIAVPIEELVWPSGRGAINGFWNQYEVMAQFQRPMDGLQALRIITENCSTIFPILPTSNSYTMRTTGRNGAPKALSALINLSAYILPTMMKSMIPTMPSKKDGLMMTGI